MEHLDNLIIVPFDFTKKAYEALEHGTCLAKTLNRKLVLLHVVTSAREVETAETKLQFIQDDCLRDYGIKPEQLIRHGAHPYAVIKSVALAMNPMMMILKHSEIRGIKHYTGIRTIKILSETMVPFLVIQDAPKSDSFTNILFPINFLTEYELKLKRVNYFKQFYPNAQMHIVTPTGKDGRLRDAIKDMAQTMEATDRNLHVTTHDGMKNTAEIILDVAQQAGTDLIITPMESVSTLSKFLFGLREEKLIANEAKIPVLCINSHSSIL